MPAPPCAFHALAHRTDAELAAHFRVPREQITARRADLSLAPRGSATSARRARGRRAYACAMPTPRGGDQRPPRRRAAGVRRRVACHLLVLLAAVLAAPVGAA